jgi:beta-lactamase regulating signal transducer with metallopeptidase domain
MSEAVFPLLGPIIVFVVILPASALVARALLAALSRVDTAHGAGGHHGTRYAILVASSALPLLWFVSASLHQSESGESAAVCAAPHDPGAFCAEAAYFSLGLAVLALAFALPRLVREQLMMRSGSGKAARSVRSRIDRLLDAHPALEPLRNRTFAADEAPVPIATVGIFSPRVIVQTTFADALDDEALVGALHHELEHVVERDPLRYFIAWWALAVNPFGRKQLASHHARWLWEREAHCDRQAVAAGAGAAALAQALVVAARPARESAFQAALGSRHAEAIRLRLGLLLAYADRRPHRCTEAKSLWGLLVALTAAVALPHSSGTALLDLVHAASERAVLLLLDG